MVGNRNLSVGIFVTAALVLFIGFTIWITGKRGSEEVAHYSIMFEDDVSGLSLGGPVYFLGVRVGEVTNMVIVPGDPPSIRVDIEVLESTPVNAGTWATLAPQGITGVSVINLSNDPGDHEPIVAAADGTHPVIPYRDSGFSAILSSAPAILTKIETLLEKANALLNEENQESIGNTLASIESLTDSLAAQQAVLASLPEEVRAALSDVRATLARVRNLLDDAGPAGVATVQNLEQTTGRLAAMTKRFDAWMDDNEAEIDEFVGTGLGQVPALIREARAAIRDLEKLLDDLRREPSSVLFKPEDNAVQVEE